MGAPNSAGIFDLPFLISASYEISGFLGRNQRPRKSPSTAPLSHILKYIFVRHPFLKNRCKVSECRQINSFITFVNTYSVNYRNRKKIDH